MKDPPQSLCPETKALVERVRSSAAQLRAESARARELVREAQSLIASVKPWTPQGD